MEIVFLILGVGGFAYLSFWFLKRNAKPPRTHEPKNPQSTIAEGEADNLKDANDRAPLS